MCAEAVVVGGSSVHWLPPAVGAVGMIAGGNAEVSCFHTGHMTGGPGWYRLVLVSPLLGKLGRREDMLQSQCSSAPTSLHYS